MSASTLPPPPGAPPRFAVTAALWLRRLFLGLADRVVPASAAMVDRASGTGQTQGLRTASRLGIADRLAAGPKTAAELAREIGADEDALHRTLRALAAAGVFRLDAHGRFANNRLSAALRSDRGAVGPVAEYFGSEATVAAWADLPRTVETGENAFPRVHGQSIWSWFDERPDQLATFAAAMGAVTEMYAPAVAGHPAFGRIARLADLGGGRGTMLAAILRRHPKLRGVLVDAPGVLDQALPYLERQGVLDRVERVPGSFFVEAPAGCDGYLLKQVLHDWDDARCRTILATCRRAAAPGAKLVVVESIVERNEASGFGAKVDLHMLVACDGGRERGREEFRRLLAESGFALSAVHPTASPVWILEATAV
ncbi:MAG TPA: methyltransferase [Thermoanaerobaculia bacterium]|nr:methyltransferase [Thermoanaerobaculia bacterium]